MIELLAVIANHTMTHPALPKLQTETIMMRIAEAHTTVKQVTGKVPTAFRAPFLQYDAGACEVGAPFHMDGRL